MAFHHSDATLQAREVADALRDQKAENKRLQAENDRLKEGVPSKGCLDQTMNHMRKHKGLWTMLFLLVLLLFFLVPGDNSK